MLRVFQIATLVIVLAGCESNNYQTGSTAAPEGSGTAEGRTYELTLAPKAIKDGFFTKIPGRIRNLTDHPINVIVEFVLLDAQDHQIGTAIDSTSNLAPGRTWEFSAFCDQEHFARFELAQVTTL